MTDLPADQPAETEVLSREPLGGAFRPLAAYEARYNDSQGKPRIQRREIVEAQSVVAVIACDPASNRIVLLRQFRLAAQLATGRGRLIEIPAGLVEEGEDAREAARREFREETGIDVSAIMPAYRVMPTPGVTDETVDVFVALADTANLPDRAGEDEDEDIEPFTASLEEALAAADDGLIVNGFTLLALNWFSRCGPAKIAELQQSAKSQP